MIIKDIREQKCREQEYNFYTNWNTLFSYAMEKERI